MLKNIKGMVEKLLPEPVKVILAKTSDDERIAHLKQLPDETVLALSKWFTYVLLAGDVVGKAAKYGIKIPTDIKNYLIAVGEECKKAGKVTIQTVSNAVDAVKTAFAVTIVIGIILFGAFCLMNPAFIMAIAMSITILEAAVWLMPISDSSESDPSEK